MAGEWIKMRTNLWDDPRVSRLCDITDQPEAMVIGGLYWLWAMADEHSEDGFLPGLTLRAVDRKTCVIGLGAALVDIGWLEEQDDGLRVVNFDDHNGGSAKRRSMDAKRKATVRKVSASDADKKTTPGGARIREELKPSHTPRDEPLQQEDGPFAMHLDWQPSARLLAAYARTAGVLFQQFTPEAIGPFIVHHTAKNTFKTEAEHVSALVNWVKRDLANAAKVVPLAGRRTVGGDFDDNATGWLGE